MQHKDFMQILRGFQADFTKNGLRNLSGIVAESFRNRSGILVEALPNLSRPYPRWIPCNMKISCKFYADS